MPEPSVKTPSATPSNATPSGGSVRVPSAEPTRPASRPVQSPPVVRPSSPSSSSPSSSSPSKTPSAKQPSQTTSQETTTHGRSSLPTRDAGREEPQRTPVIRPTNPTPSRDQGAKPGSQANDNSQSNNNPRVPVPQDNKPSRNNGRDEPSKPQAKPDAKPQPKPETKPAAKPQPKPETRPETKPEARPEPKPETKPESKPDRKPDRKPTSGSRNGSRDSADTGTTTTAPTTNTKPHRDEPSIKPSAPRDERPASPSATTKQPPARDASSTNATPRKPERVETTQQAARGSEHFVADTVHGVPVRKPSEGPSQRGGSHGAEPAVYRERGSNVAYSAGIARCNGWNSGGRWSSCGPCHTWQPYECHSGVSVAIGFGGGFSFGFFYGSSCAPLCSSWANPWWDGYASCWSCGPDPWCHSWYRPIYWSPCAPYRPWWDRCYTCGPCPYPAWTPCYTYAWAPVYTPVYYPVTYTTTYVAPPAPSLPNPDAMWSFLADGYDRDAEEGFILLEAAEPSDQRWVVGQAVARAFRGETARASDLLREAFRRDSSSIDHISHDAKFVARLEALERSLEPLNNATPPHVDALLVTAASQAARGDLSAAYLNATTAQSEGDRSSGTAAFVAWLRAELRRRI